MHQLSVEHFTSSLIALKDISLTTGWILNTLGEKDLYMNKLGERDTMRGLLSNFLLCRNVIFKFNNTGA